MLDLIVIGGGAAGYAAALRTTQLGGKVLLIEKEKLGGTCLHRGCIPSKVLFQQSGIVDDYRVSLKSGLFEGEEAIKLEAVRHQQAEVVNRLYLGLLDLFKRWDIPVINGSALVKGAGRVLVTGKETVEYESRNILITTGARERTFPFTGAEGVRGVEESLTLPEQQCRVAVIGGGNTGLELATAYASFGFKVTVVEKEKVLLPALQDEEISKWLAFLLKRRGLKLLTSTVVKNIERAEKEGRDGLKTILFRSGKEQEVYVDLIINAIGREPCLDVFAPECAGVKCTAAGISVNEHMETNVKGIFAAGDVTGSPMLAHLAYFEGITAAENVMGINRKLDLKAVPSWLAARPGVAWVGLTEQQAREAGITPQVERFSFSTNGAAVIKGREEGFVKIVAADGIILGMQVLGNAAEEVIMEGTIAVRHGLNVTQLSETIHPHPTIHEAIWEACLSLKGFPLHG